MLFYAITNKTTGQVVTGVLVKRVQNTAKQIILFMFAAVVRGYNQEGTEVLWLITSGSVVSLLLIDIDKDGQNEVRHYH